MLPTLLATKLYIPRPRAHAILRSHLLARLAGGLPGKLTLVSAPAGFGKTTLVSTWVADCGRSTAWLSLDDGDNDPARFLTYLIAALQTVAPQTGASLRDALQPGQPPSVATLTALLNELAASPAALLLVLDDYHVIESAPVDAALAFLLDNLPPQVHVVIATREDPQLPLARWRARGELTELRAADLRFSPGEAAAFLNQAMRLNLAATEIAALEARTEGWIAGLQLAALSLQGYRAAAEDDLTAFIRSFTGSHRFVMDYLVEEVLNQQPEHIQVFLLRTAILDRLCGPLCDAVVRDPAAPGQAMLEAIERANLFLIPLDNERRWYRYHHLFAELLRQRLRQQVTTPAGDAQASIAEYHVRASQWYEDNGLELDAFRHATAAHDIARAQRLLAGKGMPLHFRGAVAPVLNWLASLPTPVLDEHPGLWVTYASALSMSGQLAGVEEKLLAAEASLQGRAEDATNRNLIGHIAAIRAFLAAAHNQVETIIIQSQRALEYLHPDNLPVRTATVWKMGIAYQLRGDRAAAAQAYSEAIAASQASGNTIIHISAGIGLGQVQELDTQLHTAARTYRGILDVVGNSSQPVASEAHFGLARIHCQWNELDAAQDHAERGLHLADQMENVDNPAGSRVCLAQVHLARGELARAAELLTQAEQAVHRHQVIHRMPVVAAVQVVTLLRQGNAPAAAELAQRYDLPLSQARVLLAQNDPAAALVTLEARRQYAEARNWADERLRAMVLQVLALQAQGATEDAIQLLAEVLALAAPGGHVRLFVDEGPPMAALLSRAVARGIMPEYGDRLLTVFPAAQRANASASPPAPVQSLIDPLSERELEVLRMIAAGLKNQEIADQLVISLNTVLYHTKNIYGKLGVNKRALAIARARELALI